MEKLNVKTANVKPQNNIPVEFNVTLRQKGFLNTTAKGEITKGVRAGSRYGKMTTPSTVENVKSKTTSR